jgi:streptomycin 6-kinase
MRRRYGERGQRWLAQLPALHARCAERWELVLESALTDGQMSSLVAARTRSGEDVVLKCLPDGELARREIEALARWRPQRSVVDLIESDAEHGVLLLERIRPGTTFQGGEEACELVARALAPLHEPAAAPLTAVPALAEQIGGQLENASQRLDALPLMDRSAFEGLRRLAGSLVAPDGPAVLLHGDMQPRNILTGPGGVPILIDPRPSVGDPAFDAGTWALKQSPVEEAATRARRIAVALGLDAERVSGWMRILAAETALSRLHHRFYTEEDARRLVRVALDRD